jgi:hypothetical protein
MNLKEVIHLLGWAREKVEVAITEGIRTPVKNQLIILAASKQGTDDDIKEEDIEKFLATFEADDPGRNPPISVRRELRIESGYQCAICKSDGPPRFHHIIDWANLRHHDPAHMLAICGTCHDKIGQGMIDTKAQKIIKQRLLAQHIKNRSANGNPDIQGPSPFAEQNFDSKAAGSPNAEFLESMGLKGNKFVTVGKFHKSPTDWFHERFVAAFPGVRGIEEISNPSDAIARLSILLKAPLRWIWKVNECHTAAASPLWWWRGRGNMPINQFEVISRQEVLIDCYEFPIKRIVAANHGAYWQSFVYVEIDPKPPIGLYEKNPDADSRMLELFGYLHEEYGLYEGHAVTRAEYDDGSAIINGTPQKIPGVQLRVRYITPYNFIIASQASPVNDSSFDIRFSEILKDILRKRLSVEDLANEIGKLPKLSDFDGYD